MSDCKTGKVRYATEHAAKVVLVGSRAKQALRHSTKRSECRAYRCEFCHGWHLTSRPHKGREGAA